MPIYGLVWMASWVGCFFSASSTRFLETPSYLANLLTHQALPATNGVLPGNAALMQPSMFNSAQGSDRSGVAVRPIGPAVTSFPIALWPTSVALANGNWFKTIGAFLIPPSPSPQAVVFTANAVLRQPPQLSPKSPKSSKSPKLKSLDYFLGAFQGAWGGLQDLMARVDIASSVVVVPVKANESARTQKGSSSCVRALAVGTKPTHERFQIWVQGCLVAELPDQVQAQAMANTLTDLLKSGHFAPAQLHATQVNGMLAGQMGDRILFIIDPTTAEKLDDHAELAAVEWINNLRIALGASPLPLAEAQVKMHHLQESGGAIGGMASWYGPYFHGRQTATGEIFDQEDLTAAHPSLPFDTYLKVTNLKNGKSVVVRVNDRGPYFDDRVLDLSHRAARCIGSDDQGVVPIEATIMSVDPTLEKTSTQTVARI